METQEQNRQNEGAQKEAGRRYKKTTIAGVAIVVLSLVFIGWGTYKQWQMRRGVEKFAQILKQLEQEDYQRAMADTYGGKTPQETLQMYITAVEKGDFELASKYFIGEKQEKELTRLQEAGQKNNIDFLLNYLIQAKEAQGYFSTAGDLYAIEKPIFIEFRLYPNSIWKIMEI